MLWNVVDPSSPSAWCSRARLAGFARLAPVAWALALAAPPSFAQAPTTTRISVAFGGAQADSASFFPHITPDGKHAAFQSYASNLVAGDTNFRPDIFWVDLQTGVIVRTSVATNGTEANGDSFAPSLSADGNLVVFESNSNILVANDTNASDDVFLHDVAAGTTIRVSVDAVGTQANGGSLDPVISTDGHVIAFTSGASNLVAGDTNSVLDIFAKDLVTGAVSRVSVSTAGVQSNSNSGLAAISADGRYVAFQSDASTLDLGDTNGVTDVFVRDLLAGTTRRVSVDASGTQGDHPSQFASISSTGRFVAFSSSATNLVPGDTNGNDDVFVRDLVTNQITRVSVDSSGAQANNVSVHSAFSEDERWIVFDSRASNLVVGDANTADDVFRHDLVSGATMLVSLSTSGAQASSASLNPTVSGDGQRVVFHSTGSNIVPNDTNNAADAFLRDLGCGFSAATYCTAKTNSSNCTPAIAYTGFASASAGSGFDITAANELNNKTGFLFYGSKGQQAVPFQGGLLCVKTPFKRTALQLSGGNPPPNDCSGSYSIDFNAYIASGIDPTLVGGALIDAQYWARDPGFAPPNNTNLSNALHFSICPN